VVGVSVDVEVEVEIQDTVRLEPRFASQRRRLCEEGCCVVFV